MEEQIRCRAKRAVDEKLFPGCVVGVVGKNGDTIIIPTGRHTYSSLSPTVHEDSVYDVASITKVLPLAMVTLALAERPLHETLWARAKNVPFSLDDQVISYLPRFDTSERKRKVTIRHLLSNTVDLALPGLSSLKRETSSVIVDTVCGAELLSEPGTIYRYSNASALLLSLCLMKAIVQPLGVLADVWFFRPLHMSKTSFNPSVLLRRDIVPSEIDSWRRIELRGVVQDESTYVLQRAYGLNNIGIAGLFSTAKDILTFLEMILNGGTLYNHKYFSAKTIKDMYTNHYPQAHGAGGLGWTLYPQDYMGRYATGQTFGKTGFSGCMMLGDIQKGIGLVILSNYHYPMRKTNLEPNRQFRSDMADIVFCDAK